MTEPPTTGARNARAEADAVLHDGTSARVLEPSPPAVHDGDHLADDPVDPSGAEGVVVLPVSAGVPDDGTTWAEAVLSRPRIAEFAADRWLAAWKPLAPLPEAFTSTRDALHRLAVHVVYRARRDANGKFGLRWTLGGFGTPFFGDDVQVRVSAGALVRQSGDDVAVEPITTLAAAASFVGVDLDPDFDHGFRDVVAAGAVDEDLPVDPRAALALGDWFGFTTAVLEQVRAERRSSDPTRPQLWPEHFDIGLDLAMRPAAPAGERVNLGGSPGDGFHADPYLYVGPWTDDRPGSDGFWNAPFGAVLGYEDVVAAGDGAAQRDRALAFLREGLDRLADA